MPALSLLQYANPDGGLPYAPGGPSFSEPSLLAILTLAAEGKAKEAAPLIRWALDSRNPDGSIGLSREFPKEGLWNSSLLAIAAHHMKLLPERDAAIDFLMKWHSTQVPNQKENDIDTSLVGWPWVPNTFGWVEPTSWALIALSLAGKSGHPRSAEGRMLLENRCIPNGGWNYGNKIVFGHPLMPFWDSSALALLALGDTNPELTGRNLAFLEKSLPKIESLLSNSLICICFERFGLPTEALSGRIAAILRDPEMATLNLGHAALGFLALSGRRML